MENSSQSSDLASCCEEMIKIPPFPSADHDLHDDDNNLGGSHEKINGKTDEFEIKERSEDVLLSGKDVNTDFSSFNLSPPIIKGLQNVGFQHPSPIQLNAIPIGMIGCDMLIQAKSGTGKTCVFSVLALERVDVTIDKIQVLIICPSREIADQTKHVVKAIGKFKEGLKVRSFIGGCPLGSDIEKMSKCHIAIGTPGRLLHLLREFSLPLSSVSLFVLDEADKLFENSFVEDLEEIYGAIPQKAQVVGVSATFENGIERSISMLMKEPVKVEVGTSSMTLLAVEQYAIDVRKLYNFIPQEGQSIKLEEIMKLKFECLLELLTTLPYSQAVIFSTYQSKAQRIFEELQKEGLDVVLLSGALKQDIRLDSFHQLQSGRVKLMVCTDVGARGLDFEHVDLVINFEIPLDLPTYIHRMGRCGRFGSFGRLFSLLSFQNDWTELLNFQCRANLSISLLSSHAELSALIRLKRGKLGENCKNDGKLANGTELGYKLLSNRKGRKEEESGSILSKSEAFDVGMNISTSSTIGAVYSGTDLHFWAHELDYEVDWAEGEEFLDKIYEEEKKRIEEEEEEGKNSEKCEEGPKLSGAKVIISQFQALSVNGERNKNKKCEKNSSAKNENRGEIGNSNRLFEEEEVRNFPSLKFEKVDRETGGTGKNYIIPQPEIEFSSESESESESNSSGAEDVI